MSYPMNWGYYLKRFLEKRWAETWNELQEKIAKVNYKNSIKKGNKNINNTTVNLTNIIEYIVGFPGGSASKESSCNIGDLSLTPGSGKSLEKGMDARYMLC